MALEPGDEVGAMRASLSASPIELMESRIPSPRSSARHSRESMTICSASTSGPAKPSASTSS
jgi:hypothetical protein